MTSPDSNGTYNTVVLAAHGLGAAATASDADDGDRRAVKPDEHVHILNDDAEKTQKGSCRGVGGLEKVQVNTMKALES